MFPYRKCCGRNSPLSSKLECFLNGFRLIPTRIRMYRQLKSMEDCVVTCLEIVKVEVPERTERFWTTLPLKLPKLLMGGSCVHDLKGLGVIQDLHQCLGGCNLTLRDPIQGGQKGGHVDRCPDLICRFT